MNFKEALIAHLQGEKVEVLLRSGWTPFMKIYGYTAMEYVDRSDAGEGDEYRLAPRTIIVNGVEVPAPEKVTPEYWTTFYTPSPYRLDFVSAQSWDGHKFDLTTFERGLVYLNKEDAIARSKAMLITQEAV